jgi:hypothetical protein
MFDWSKDYVVIVFTKNTTQRHKLDEAGDAVDKARYLGYGHHEFRQEKAI